jgi:tRNA nucleotidyltransferase (CCA-adding enzyme)
VNRLIDLIRTAVHANTKFKIVRVVKAGSFAKHTILRKSGDAKIDVDVVFYFEELDDNTEDYQTLSNRIYDFLIDSYPNKKVDDFELQRKAATVSFAATGLDVDLVPVIQEPAKPEYGWQYGLDGSKVITCAPCQVGFVKKRKDTDGQFRRLVRLAKQWRRYHDIPGLKSFHIELIMAHLLDTNGKNGLLEERFCQFLLYIAQSGLKDVISFPENVEGISSFTDPVVIIDPVNGKNNTTSRISETERQGIVTQAQQSWEDAHNASVDDDLAGWKDVFGPRFKVED